VAQDPAQPAQPAQPAEGAEPAEPADLSGFRRWRLLVAYNGRRFRGFAEQDGVPTVAGELAAALKRATRMPEAPPLTCAGRTDAGVHARGQVVHVDLPTPLPTLRRRGLEWEMTGQDLVNAVNRQIAPDVVVRAAELAPPGFDARRSAVARRYRYLVWNSPCPDPLLDPVAWHVAEPLDLAAMRSASDAVEGEHDFRGFCRRPPGAPANQPILRRVRRTSWHDLPAPVGADGAVDAAPGDQGRLLRFDIEADAFCHQMVRSLVAVLVEVGRGRERVAGVVARLRSGERAGAPRPAPACGLCLVAVRYPQGEAMLVRRS
jgi:tRNA pseudouridine38-40 synthase